jgi:hypothetical protein
MSGYALLNASMTGLNSDSLREVYTTTCIASAGAGGAVVDETVGALVGVEACGAPQAASIAAALTPAAKDASFVIPAAIVWIRPIMRNYQRHDPDSAGLQSKLWATQTVF